MTKKPVILLFILFLLPVFCFAQKKLVWIDSDTANEMDDLYAITFLLTDPGVKVMGLSSAHFNNPDLLINSKWNSYPTKNINTVKLSQQLNEQLLSLLPKQSVLHPMGGKGAIGHSWGGLEPVNSDAAKELIKTIHNLKAGEHLDILVTGASSNVASAILLDSNIVSKISVYMLGASYDANRRIWNKNEFNVRNDLNAFDYLLNNKKLDLTVMPVNTAIALRFIRSVSQVYLKNKGKMGDLLSKRWDLVAAKDTWIMWDLSMVIAYLNPVTAIKIKAGTPPENRQRQISIYKSIDAIRMEDMFWKRMNIFNSN